MRPAILANPATEASASRLAIAQAVAALSAGDCAEAERTLRQRVSIRPDDDEALAKLAEIAIDLGNAEQAAVLLRRAATAAPSPARQTALLNHLLAFAGPAAALAEIQSWAPSRRRDFSLRALEAQLLGMVGEHERELALYESLGAERPLDTVLWIKKAHAFVALGRVEDAVGSLRQAIRIQPTCGAAYWTLANLKTWRFGDRDLSAMRKALRTALADVDRIPFEFALGRALEQRGQFAESFEHYAHGNRIRAAALLPEQMQVTAFVDEAIATFSADLLARPRHNRCEAADPIFVLGLHRSGSTLIEQMLASHPSIEGTGELPVMQQIWDRLCRTAVRAGQSPFAMLAQWDADEFEKIGAEYLERTRPFRSTSKPMFVDKLPANWLHVGLIRLALPNARIVDARRHPMACGFSNFKQLYSVGVNYSYSLDSIGRFYRDYLRLMNHFDRVQPGAVHHLVNERLIDDPEGELRRLIDYVGVPFDPACLDFHRNKRSVNTPSAEQVRRPINRDGVDAWRSFEPWLLPLKQSLGSVRDSWF